MNKELFLKIREEIIARPEHFAFRYFLDAQNLKMCIGGWAVWINEYGVGAKITSKKMYNTANKNLNDEAIKLLGMKDSDIFIYPFGFEQFCPPYENCETSSLFAIKMIDSLLENGSYQVLPE